MRFTPDTDVRCGVVKRRAQALVKLLRQPRVCAARPEALAEVLRVYLKNHALSPGVPKRQRRNEQALCEAMQKIIDSKTMGTWPQVEYHTMDADTQDA